MALTSLADVDNGMRPTTNFFKADAGTNVSGMVHSTWATAGNPGAGSFDATLNGVVLTSSSAVTGQIPFTDPPSGNAYLARMQGGMNRVDVLANAHVMLADRIWHNGGITITSSAPQVIATPAWPARDDDGATSGKGVFIACEVSAVCGAAVPSLTISYTNTAGVSGRTGTNIFVTVSASAAGSFYLFSLQAGDVGVKSVESMTLSTSWISGTINLVAFRVLIDLAETGAAFNGGADALTGGLTKLYNGSVPWILVFSNSTSGLTGCGGTIIYTWG